MCVPCVLRFLQIAHMVWGGFVRAIGLMSFSSLLLNLAKVNRRCRCDEVGPVHLTAEGCFGHSDATGREQKRSCCPCGESVATCAPIQTQPTHFDANLGSAH